MENVHFQIVFFFISSNICCTILYITALLRNKKENDKRTSVRPVFDLTSGLSHGLYNSGSEVDKSPHKKLVHKLLEDPHK